MSQKKTNDIEIHHAHVHNLKDVSVTIPRNKLVVICGVSGSGKSSLAFDTLYEEGQRRYLEGLSSYVRQFLGGFKKPDVEKIVGLSPTLAINQKSVSSNPRSTVGTITEIYDHLRLLFARVGIPYCPDCHKKITSQTPQEITEAILSHASEGEVRILAPIVDGKKGEHRAVLDEIGRSGYPRLRINGSYVSLDEAQGMELDKNKKHTIEVVVGSVMTGLKIDVAGAVSKKEKEALKKKKKRIEKLMKEESSDIIEKVRKALVMGKGFVRISITPIGKKEATKDITYSEHYTCSTCGFSVSHIEPRSFSFNSPYGACPVCQGLGTKLEIDLSLLLAPEISLEAGAIKPWYALNRMARRALGTQWQKFVTRTILEQAGIDRTTPFKNLPKDTQNTILYGNKDEVIYLEDGDWKGKTKFEGVIPRLERLYYETESDYIRKELSRYMREKICSACEGSRIKKESRAIYIGEKNIFDLVSMPVKDLFSFLKKDIYTGMSNEQKTIAESIIKEIQTKVRFLIDVGLEYMTIHRSATTLSVGENQRIRLATQLGVGLSGVIYVLDEPTIGLHAQDTDKLVDTLHHLRDLQNTVVVVEHDERVIDRADWIIEIGPRAGHEGGKVVFEGTPAQLKKAHTLTGEYVSGKKKVTHPHKQIPRKEKKIVLSGATQFNLKNVTLTVPLNTFVCVAGMSGSGKSTLILEVFAKALQKEVSSMAVVPGAYKTLTGHEALQKVVLIDQSPIGKTPRSNPATYTGILTPIRQLYARLDESQIRGYSPSHFSFNVKPGRCEACRGEGYKKVEMYFLPDMYVPCDICQGKRFSPDVLEVLYKGKSIADVLDLSIREAKEFFAPFPVIADKLELLDSIGLGYMKLGQSATTLSGGEAQRIKLADELSKKSHGNTMYILDEPTVGLHFDDVRKLLFILTSLVEKGNSVLVIEHNLDVLKQAQWIIELGPRGGEEGGKIVFEGTLNEAVEKNTATGKYLKKHDQSASKSTKK